LLPILPLRDYEEQGVYNRVAPLVDTRLSALRRLSYALTVRPRTADASDNEKSGIATRLLAYAQERGDFAEKKNEMLTQAELYGTSFLLSYWEEGEEDTIGYRVLSPFAVFPESLCKSTVAEQESILIADVLSVSEIEDSFGVRVTGTDADVYSLSPIACGGMWGSFGSSLAFSAAREKDCATVLTYLERPSKRHPKGLYILATEDRVLWYSDLPYDDIPLVMLRSRDMPSQFFGRSPILDLIPLQRAYNGVKNKIHDYIRAVAANPLLVPEGSIPDVEAFAAEGLPPGEIVEYNAERGKPEPLSPAPIPAELRLECERLCAEMEYAAGVSQLTVVGRTPAGVTSGTAIANLREIDNARLALTGENLRLAVRQAALSWLSIFRRYISGYRTLSICGENEAAGVLIFCSEDLNSSDVVLCSENELIISPEVQKQNFVTALQMGLYNDEDGKLPRSVQSYARRLLQGEGEDGPMSCDELQIAAAERENAALSLGKLPSVSLFDDHELHAEAHKKHLLQARFAFLREKEPTLCEAFERHIVEHLLRAKGGGAGHDEHST
ncbi:MAG: hypothetical protein IJ012_07955, partial [Clostridia bacterium]|nr:hypothetical protein [Clostridia bacterium]